ncbi:class I SAM-dependent methyltransferase [Cyanobium sp. CH-040]|uniref:class I SAM-dependent methyltransferase n=1 Tax=Cyanobium sp. CH-040 TaxID=2823708 RepID=UPI0020CFE0D6|nr:class I SAM-dependent methyltransferase [Cyanobium sp. CH-040]MCP9928211.1 methyltransferase domain-containing protein [Cyanobium sp. CH-040]
MAYEQDTAYLRIFDPHQSPAHFEVMAGRFGAAVAAVDASRTYLDLGCGPGHSILALAPLYPWVQFIGVDFNQLHVEAARQEAQRLDLDNVCVHQADFRQLPPDLPRAHYLVLRGTYSWLESTVRNAVERSLGELLLPAGLLKLHSIVRPGGLLRQTLMCVIQQALGDTADPERGRQFLDELVGECHGLELCFSHAGKAIELMRAESDEAWRHDILNPDFSIETAAQLFARFEGLGLRFLASANHERNLPLLQVGEGMARRLQALPPGRAQTLLDHLSGNGTRDDLFLREPAPTGPRRFAAPWRFGLIVLPHQAHQPHQTVRGQILFTHDDCRRILEVLAETPLTFPELHRRLEPMAVESIVLWLDLLLAARRIGPFLPASQTGLADRGRLRRLNRERLRQTVADLSVRTTTPLLAAEYGNCLVAGWFESLVLDQFERRHDPKVQQRLLQRIAKAGLNLGGSAGQARDDPSVAFRSRLRQLDQLYIPRLPYWGIEL